MIKHRFLYVGFYCTKLAEFFFQMFDSLLIKMENLDFLIPFVSNQLNKTVVSYVFIALK